jgi:general secretion pathway protein K
MATARHQDRGSVLMSVLWIVLVLSLISFSLASTVRVEMDSSLQAFDSERAFFMAKSAAELVLDSEKKQQPLPLDGPVKQENGEYIFQFDAGEAHVRYASDAGLIDVNSASDVQLAAIFDSLSLDRETRNRMVDSILDWIDADDIPHLYGGEIADYPTPIAGQLRRPRNGAFQSVDELLLVRNMTTEIFFGSIVADPATNRYRRIPGLRELVTVRSGHAEVDPNIASKEVLTALPLMTSEIAEQVVAERMQGTFENGDALLKRVPQMQKNTLQYLRFGNSEPFELVSTGVIKSSGVTRTVRMLFRKEETLKILVLTPLVYKRVMEIKVDRWRFE